MIELFLKQICKKKCIVLPVVNVLTLSDRINVLEAKKYIYTYHINHKRGGI